MHAILRITSWIVRALRLFCSFKSHSYSSASTLCWKIGNHQHQQLCKAVEIKENLNTEIHNACMGRKAKDEGLKCVTIKEIKEASREAKILKIIHPVETE